MNTLLLIINVASLLGYTLSIDSVPPADDAVCMRWNDNAAIFVCPNEANKTATIHLIEYIP